MGLQKAQTINLSDKEGIFSGGYVDNVSSLYLSNKYSPYLRNARIDGQSVIIRYGHELFVELESGDYPRGIGTYLRANPSNDKLIIRHNIDSTHKLYTLDSTGTLTSIDTSSNIASDNRMRFLNIGEVVYCMNGSDYLGKLSNTTYTVPSTGISNFAPSIGVSFSGCFWASGWATNPNVLYKSVDNSVEDFSGAGSDTFNFLENITGLSENNRTLLVFTPRTISTVDLGDFDQTNGRISYKTATLQTNEGTKYNDCIVTVGLNTYFLTSSNEIVKIARGNNIDGFEILGLSDRKYTGISEILKTLDKDQTGAFAYFVQDANIIKWFLKTEGFSFNNICVVYDLSKDAFLIDDNKPFYGGIYFNGFNYTISNLEPKVYKDEYEQADENTPIFFEYMTKDFYVGSPFFKKVFWETRTLAYINELAELEQTILINGETRDTRTIDKTNINQFLGGGIASYPIGDRAIGEGGYETEELQPVLLLRTKGNLNIRGEYITFKFVSNTLGAKIRLENIFLTFEQTPALATNNLPSNGVGYDIVEKTLIVY